MKYIVSNLTALVGMNVLTAGKEIPDNWSITPADRFVLYEDTAVVTTSYGHVDNTSLFTTFTEVKGVNLLDGTSRTEPSGNTPIPIIFVQYSADSCESDAYKISDSPSSIASSNGVNAVKYLDMVADGATVYMNFAKVPAAVNSILALKLSIKSLASVNLQNGEWLINIAGKEAATKLSLPNTIQQKDVMIEGSWLTSDINSAQVGFRART